MRHSKASRKCIPEPTSYSGESKRRSKWQRKNFFSGIEIGDGAVFGSGKHAESEYQAQSCTTYESSKTDGHDFDIHK
jgi:hypothetical protein